MGAARRWVVGGSTAIVVAGLCWLPTGPASAELVGLTGAAEVAVPAVAAARACPTWGSPESSGAAGPSLPELSGLAPALTSGEWWTHNDSGDTARIFRVDSQLAVTAEVALNVPFALDVEDIAMAPDGRLWVADIGDNFRIRGSVVLWGLRPPETTATVTPTTLTLTYPDGAQDAEALMFDPMTGDGFIVAKAVVGGRAHVFRIPAVTLAAPSGTSFALELVASIDVSDGGSIGPTAADISPSGSYIAVKTLTTTYIWLRNRGSTVIETFTASPHAPCQVAGAGSNEALAFSLDSRTIATVAEGVGSPLVVLRRVTP